MNGLRSVVHVYNGMLLSHKKNEIMPFTATWMELSQKEKDKYHVISLIMWNRKYGTNEPIYRIETDSQT